MSSTLGLMAEGPRCKSCQAKLPHPVFPSGASTFEHRFLAIPLPLVALHLNSNPSVCFSTHKPRSMRQRRILQLSVLGSWDCVSAMCNNIRLYRWDSPSKHIKLTTLHSFCTYRTFAGRVSDILPVILVLSLGYALQRMFAGTRH